LRSAVPSSTSAELQTAKLGTGEVPWPVEKPSEAELEELLSRVNANGTTGRPGEAGMELMVDTMEPSGQLICGPPPAGPDRAFRLKDCVGQLVRAVRPTPVVRLDFPGIKLHAKLEQHGLVGSVKDRAALWILKSAIERGTIGPGSPVVESSSGNFAIALAVYSRLLGLDFTPVIDPNISPLYESSLRSLCRTVVKVDQRDDTGGFLKTRLATVRNVLQASPGAFWPNQYANVDGMMGHYHLTGAEICSCLPDIDFVFVGVSSAGTIAGISQRLKERFPHAKVIAVDAEGSVIFGGSPKKRHIPGIGSSVVPDLLQHARIDDWVLVREADTVAACRELVERHQLFVGGSSGSVYHAIKQYFGVPRSRRTEPTVLFLCADRGAAYLDTVYDDGWCAKLEEAG
jgi:cysteine synthase A